MDMKVKKRAWVKNAVIVFLLVLLVLTFFSNTIMNRSLPEVAAKNVAEGPITARVRGSVPRPAVPARTAMDNSLIYTVFHDCRACKKPLPGVH